MSVDSYKQELRPKDEHFIKAIQADKICPVCFADTYCRTNCRHALCLNCSSQLDFCPVCEDDLDHGQMREEYYENGNTKYTSLKQPHMNILAHYNLDGSLNTITSTNERNQMTQVYYPGINKLHTVTTVLGGLSVTECNYDESGVLLSRWQSLVSNNRRVYYFEDGTEQGIDNYFGNMLHSRNGEYARKYILRLPFQRSVLCFEWHDMGVLHRTDGPAVLRGDSKEWWLNGERYSYLGWKLRKLLL